MQAAILEASQKFPKPSDFIPRYGTAGYRAEAHLLHSTMFRCGILMAIRALVQKETKVTGICLTASHNPAPDNGIKMVEPTGEMLQQRFEPIADEFANADSDEDLARLVLEFMAKEGVAADATGTVLIAHDTRPSGPELAEAAAAGVRCVGAEPQFLGLLTTPQLHWAVMRTNQKLPSGEADYYSVLSSAFVELAGKADPPMPLYVDCANGVGGPKIGALAPHLEAAGLNLKLLNIGEGVLNGGCGSDFVQNNRTTPESFEDIPAGARCCAVDGDADRLVYFSPLESYDNGGDKAKKVILLDGDKIAALAAGLIKDLVAQLPGDLKSSSVGVVQTAYANGASTKFLKESVECDVAVTPTGVKFLHEAAHAFDAGIYFEANGHGTVLFKSSFLKALATVAGENSAATELLALNSVINAAVGDAVSGILIVEAALRRKKWSLEQWAGLYADLPSCQMKVKVADRSVISTTDAERRVAEPKALQDKIDELVAGVPGGRSFVRPSGTEDVVRVYAEADSVEEMEKLATSVAKAVYQLAGGLGPEP
jgi:phosphoacetylglucosamine mutase